MKKALFIFLLCLIFVFSTLSGCNERTKTVTIAADEDDGFDISAAVEEYNKTAKVKVKIISKEKHDLADMFIFNTNDFALVKDICEDLSENTHGIINKSLCFTEEQYVYGIPLYTDYSFLIYNKRLVENAGITDYNSFHNSVFAANEKDVKGFALPTDNMGEIVDSLLGYVLFSEFELGDDYNYPPNAAANSKQIILRYTDNLKDFSDLIKQGYLTTKSTKESLDAVKTQKALITVSNTKLTDPDSLDNDLAVCPVFMDLDGENENSFGTITGTFFAKNKNATEEKKSNADAFFVWISENGEKYLKNKGSVFPYKNGTENSIKEVLSESNRNIVTLVNSAFPNDFSSLAADGLIDYIEGNATWEYTEKLIISLWKNGR